MMFEAGDSKGAVSFPTSAGLARCRCCRLTYPSSLELCKLLTLTEQFLRWWKSTQARELKIYLRRTKNRSGVVRKKHGQSSIKANGGVLARTQRSAQGPSFMHRSLGHHDIFCASTRPAGRSVQLKSCDQDQTSFAVMPAKIIILWL